MRAIEKKTLEEKKLDVLLVKPGKYPQQIQIDIGPNALVEVVGSYIEVVYPFSEPVALVVNGVGKLDGSELNRGLYTDAGELYDIVAGSFLVVGLDEGDLASLSPDLMQKFEDKFHQPEVFVPISMTEKQTEDYNC